MPPAAASVDGVIPLSRGAALLYASRMSDDPWRESRAALILMGVCVLAVLAFGAVTLIAQAG